MSVINTNVKALAAQASMSNVNKSMETAMERLSTGIRINSAKDDAAGLAIALRMTADIRGTAVAIRNANDGISLSQTAEGGLGQINDILQRMRELAVQSSNGTAAPDNRQASQLEISQLKQEIDTIANRTNFNGIKLLDGTAAKLNIQTGVNAGDMMTMQISAARTQDIGIGGRASLTATGQSGGQGALAKQLNAGDLIINGVSVGASDASSDNISAAPLETITMSFTHAIANDATVIFDGITVKGTTADSATPTTAAAFFIAQYNAGGTGGATSMRFVAEADGTTKVRLTAKAPGNLTDAANPVTGDAANKPTFTIAQGGGDKASSAIAKVAAINAVSAQSGVIATVGTTTVAGTKQVVADLTGTVTINGVETGAFSTTQDAGVSRTNAIAAINLISAQTGVRAVDTGDINKGVQLIADDGRNITLAMKNLTAAATGLASPGVTTGSYQLTSISGAPIVLGSSSSGNISSAGLTAGNYTSNVSTVTSVSRTVASAAPAAGTSGLLEAGTMRINGIAIDAAVTASDTASNATTTSSKSASSIAIAAAINAKSSLTGVTAKADANVIVGTAFTDNGLAKTLRLNGVTIEMTADQSKTRAGVAIEINKSSGQTGVVASDNGRGLTLVAADGRNISLAVVTNTADPAGGTPETAATGNTSRANSIGLDSTNTFTHATAATTNQAFTTYGTVTLTSELSFKLEGGSDGNQSFGSLGFKTGTIGGANNGIKIASIDVSTQTGAQLAITALDAAMKSVSMNQAQLGAYQNRLDSAIANLTEGSTNMNASRSRVLDTDYAKESTNLAKAQIISQAATAMLAQANQSAQSVLALLK
jgi:flagellin